MVMLIILSSTQHNQPAMQNSEAEKLDDQQARSTDAQPERDSQQFTPGSPQNERDPRAAIENNVADGKRVHQENQAFGPCCHVNGNEARGERTKQANTAVSDATAFAFSKINNWIFASLLLCFLLQVIIGLASSVKDLVER